jgi:hypothetical protein
MRECMEACRRMKDGKNKSGNDERLRKKGTIKDCMKEVGREHRRVC